MLATDAETINWQNVTASTVETQRRQVMRPHISRADPRVEKLSSRRDYELLDSTCSCIKTLYVKKAISLRLPKKEKWYQMLLAVRVSHFPTAQSF